MNPPGVRRSAMEGAALGLLSAAPLAWYLRGFTVDDALIPARYAHHLACGLGYRFNRAGPSSDGVTPLGFAHLLAPFARASVLAAWATSRWLGRAAWLGAAAALGAGICASSATQNSGGRGAASDARAARFARLSLLLVLCSAPLGAWCSSGLETPWVVALVTLAAVLPPRAGYAWLGSLLAGASAWLRPEMLTFASVVALGRARTASTRAARIVCVASGLAPWVIVAATRWALWGTPAPLAVLAKPSDLTHGITYALPAVLFTGAPCVALAPGSWRRLSVWARTLLVAGVAQLATIALAGGDWMPLARLVCPLLPAFVVVSAELLRDEKARRSAVVRLSVACAAELAVLALRGEAARHVASDRLALIAAARPLMEGAARIATVDVGWVGAATDAEIVDLAGATDAEIAALPGGHTSKAVGVAFLGARHPDLLVFQLGPRGSAGERRADDTPDRPRRLVFARAVEDRLAHDPGIARAFAPVWTSPPELPVAYVALARVRE